MRPALVAAAQSMGLAAYDGYDGVSCRLEDGTRLAWEESRYAFALHISLAQQLPPEAEAAQFAAAKKRADEIWLRAVELRRTMAPPGVTYVVPLDDGRLHHRRRGADLCRNSLECGTNEWCKDRGDGVRVCMGDGREGDFCRSSVDCAGSLWCRETSRQVKVCRR